MKDFFISNEIKQVQINLIRLNLEKKFDFTSLKLTSFNLNFDQLFSKFLPSSYGYLS